MEFEPENIETPLVKSLLEDEVTEIEAREALGHDDARIHIASQWQLIWWRFRRHKLALFSAILLVIIYFVTQMLRVVFARILM